MGENMNFLQSPEWRKFQEAVGRKTYTSPPASPAGGSPSPYKGEGDFSVSVIEHQLPIVGKYFYLPKNQIFNFQPASPAGGFSIFNQFPISNDQVSKQMREIVELAKQNKVSWIRVDLENIEVLELIKKAGYKIVKAPHDMQPRQIFVLDITKSEEELLAEMKAKTRYNIRLAGKKKVKVACIMYNVSCIRYIEEFIRLTKIMAKRQGITAHPDEYYRKMFETIPGEILKLYVAEYQNKIVAANIMIFYGDVCTYLHGASDDEYRNVMAPYLLQWQAIKDAKEVGCKSYDFGGVKTLPHPSPLLIKEREQKPSPLQGEGAPLRRSLSEASRRADEVNSWAGITRFKLGFSPNTQSLEFPGSYDIILSSGKYWLYRIIQKVKSLL